MHGIQDQAVTRITTLEQMVLKRFWHWITRHVDTVKKQKIIHKGTRWEHELKFFIKYAEKGIRSKGSSNLFIRMIDSYVFGGKKEKKTIRSFNRFDLLFYLDRSSMIRKWWKECIPEWTSHCTITLYVFTRWFCYINCKILYKKYGQIQI